MNAPRPVTARTPEGSRFVAATLAFVRKFFAMTSLELDEALHGR
jgi:hypothetical protein